MHSDLRDIDGLHADAALDELCKLIFLKTLDESTTAPGDAVRLQTGLYDDARAMTKAVRRLAEECPDAPAGALAEPLIISDAALYRLIERLEPYSLLDSDVDLKARAFQRVLSPAVRAGMGQYFTPLPVIRFMVRVVDPGREDRVVDPFGGSGGFLAASFRRVAAGLDGADLAAFEHDAPGRLHAIEKSDRMVRIATVDMLLHGGVRATLHCRDSLRPFDGQTGIGPGAFDVVLTNPPFGSLLRREAIDALGPFSIAAGRASAPLEVLGLERSVELLRPGGRLAIVLPDGLLANTQSGYVRRWLLERVVPRAIVGLPVLTFAPFGANVKTSILFARTRAHDEAADDGARVFMASARSVGYDATGREAGESDLPELAEGLEAFFAQEGW